MTHTQTHTHTHTLNEGLAGRTELYLNTDSTHMKQTSMHPAGFEPAIPAGEAVTLFQRNEVYKNDEIFTGTFIKNREMSVKVSFDSPSKEDLGRVLLRE